MKRARLPARRMPRLQRGWTLLEIIIAIGIIIVILTTLGWLVSSALRGTRRITSGTFTTAPGQISLSAGGTGRFVYKVQQTVGGGSASPITARTTSFTVSPSPGALIESVTDAAGNTLAVNAASGTGVTDAGGDITVVIVITATGTFTLTATDGPTGLVETVTFTGVE